MIVKRLNKDFCLLDNSLIVHKGIYGYSYKLKRYVKPNSFDACKLAIDNNIDFECDIRNTFDNIPVVIHDSFVRNINGKKIKISKFSYSELSKILKENTPPKLEDILEYNNGKVGVIVDAKEAHIFYSKYRENLSRLLNKYSLKGEIILESFNPFFMLSLRKHIKNVVTCQLICRGKTILEAFRTPRSIAYIYERIISVICFISKADVIGLENHANIKWQRRNRYFLSQKTNNKIELKRKKIANKLENSIYRGIGNIIKIMDKIQLKIIKFAYELTKKPILAFTIKRESEYNLMESLYIISYIVDFSSKGTEEYINMINKRKK